MKCLMHVFISKINDIMQRVSINIFDCITVWWKIQFIVYFIFECKSRDTVDTFLVLFALPKMVSTSLNIFQRSQSYYNLITIFILKPEMCFNGTDLNALCIMMTKQYT